MRILMYIMAAISFAFGVVSIGSIRSDIQIQIVVSFLLFAFVFLGLGSIMSKISRPDQTP